MTKRNSLLPPESIPQLIQLDKTAGGEWELFPADIPPITSTTLCAENWDNTCGGMCPLCGALTRDAMKGVLPLSIVEAPFAAARGDTLAQAYRCVFCDQPLWYHISDVVAEELRTERAAAVRVEGRRR